MAGSKLSFEFSPLTYPAACVPFTPSDFEQRLHLTYYRDCWHVISRCFFCRYRHRHDISFAPYSSLPKEVYNPKAFVPHVGLLRQAFAHCGIFLTTASRRSPGRISVPMWPITLSGRLPIVALVGHYPTNKLMGRRLIHQCGHRRFHSVNKYRAYRVLIPVSRSYPRLEGRLSTHYSPVRRSPP